MNEPRVIVIGTNERVVERGRGPAGPAGPAGDDGEVASDAIASNDGEVAVFSGTSGERIKRSNLLVSALATVAALGNKVDKVMGKGLSTNDFTTVLKDKLTALSSGTYRGDYADEATLVSVVTDAVEGDWAIVVPAVPDPDAEAIFYFWDNVNETWTGTAPASTPSTAVEILAALNAWKSSNPTFDWNPLTNTRLAQLNDTISTATFNAAIAAFSGDTAFATAVDVSTLTKVLAIGDIGNYLRLTNIGGCDITLENDATVTWLSFPEIRFMIATAGTITITLGSGVTLNNSAGLAGLVQWDTFRLKKIGADTWDLIVGG